MKLFETKKLFTRFLAVVVISAAFYSCKCVKCLVTPPPLTPMATDLVAMNHLIDSSLSEEWINRYKMYKDSVCTNTLYTQDSVFYNYESFTKKYIVELLCSDGCIGLRVYYGMDADFKVHTIINGIDQKGDDLFYKYKSGDPIPIGAGSVPLRAGLVPPVGTSLRIENGMGQPS